MLHKLCFKIGNARNNNRRRTEKGEKDEELEVCSESTNRRKTEKDLFCNFEKFRKNLWNQILIRIITQINVGPKSR